MRRKPPINEFAHKPPNAKEMRLAVNMARRASRRLWAMMTARSVKKDA